MEPVTVPAAAELISIYVQALREGNLPPSLRGLYDRLREPFGWTDSTSVEQMSADLAEHLDRHPLFGVELAEQVRQMVAALERAGQTVPVDDT